MFLFHVNKDNFIKLSDREREKDEEKVREMK